MTDKEKMYRRQLGGAEAALRRERQRVKALEELVRDMWFWGYEGHMNSESQDWQMKHIDGVLDRMHELGIGVES